MWFGNELKRIDSLAAAGKIEKILPFIQSPKKATRVAAIKAVSGGQSEGIYNAMMSRLGSDDVEERLLVVEALGKCGKRDAIPALDEALKKETSATVVNAIKMAISRLRTLPEGVKIL